jgi:peptide/nickel transport system permease protein
MGLTDLFLALPLLPLLLVMVMLFRETLSRSFGPEMGTFILIVSAIGVTSWMQTARIVRGEVLALKEREFVLAARSIGTPSRRMILRHILPNVLSPIMVSATLGIATAIITESALSFLGLGFRRISRPGAACCLMRLTIFSNIRSGCSGRDWRFR